MPTDSTARMPSQNFQSCGNTSGRIGADEREEVKESRIWEAVTCAPCSQPAG